MTAKPTPREVKALRVDVVREAKRAILSRLKHHTIPRGQMRWGDGSRRCWNVLGCRHEVRFIRNLILHDLRQLEYELKHGIGKRMPKKRKAR